MTVTMVNEKGTATAMARDLRARLALALLSSRLVIIVVGLVENGMVFGFLFQESKGKLMEDFLRKQSRRQLQRLTV